MRMILSAPQVTSVAAIEALPERTQLLISVLGGYWLVRWNGVELVSEGPDPNRAPGWVLERYGPLTVIWQPDAA